MMTLIDNQKEYAVVPMDEYMLMNSLKEDYDDVLRIAKAKQEIAQGQDELIPLEIMERLMSDESKLKVWHEYRKLTPKDLSEKSGVSVSVISKIENNKQSIDLIKMRKFVAVLNLDYDDLLNQ